MADMVAKKRHWQSRRTHCSRGHEYTAENTRLYVPRNRHGFARQCLTCERERSTRRRTEGLAA
jgi:hypothetical protein